MEPHPNALDFYLLSYIYFLVGSLFLLVRRPAVRCRGAKSDEQLDVHESQRGLDTAVIGRMLISIGARRRECSAAALIGGTAMTQLSNWRRV